ncbi:hypothetical protein [Nocardioides jensenii]|uniref:hypothetical protein n=1 Tax=Nocardioides jensenii TaxID=1843 RepID=UPI00082A830F|nr:hypothetical protein [Nocardioides jensenii]
MKSIAAAVVLLFTATACGATADTPSQVRDSAPDRPLSDRPASEPRAPDARAARAALEFLEVRRESADVLGSFAESLEDYLPGQLVEIDGRDPVPLALGVVHGTIRRAEPYAAYATAEPETDGGPDGVQVEWADPDADWRVIAVTLDITEAWGDGVPHSGQLRFALPDGEDSESFMRGIESLGEAVLVLGSTHSSDESLFRLVEQDAAIGLVDQKGAVRFPAFGLDAEAFVRGVGTLPAIAAKAEVKQPLIVVKKLRVVSR